jgi:hypothetical protein
MKYYKNNLFKLVIGILLFINSGVLQAQDMLTPNLIRNSYLLLLDETKPVGFSVTGNVNLEAVHPYTKGFEGPYVSTAPANAASNVDLATENSPYWFGYYNKGSRARRGGLASGWNSYPNGRILKITGDNSAVHTAIYFPFEKNVLASRVRFRAWIKITKGEKVSFGSDTGYKNGARGFQVSKTTADAAVDGWYRIDTEISISEITKLDWYAFSMGLHGNDIEVYLALPHLSVIETDSWLPSVSDMLSVNGLTIRPDNRFVGIGTMEPSSALEVNGTIKATNIKATEIKVEAQTADFVFEEDYHLKSLEEVEQFITNNKHLPDVPSAKQMEENGVGLAEMNKLLLQKVEELTLYLIEQKKINNELEVRVKELESIIYKK